MASLRDLEYVAAVADHGSITAAALALHVSQPALSQALAELEREYGGPLFTRSVRGMTLTVAGRVALPAIRACVNQSQRARMLARQSNGVERGELRIACAQSITVGILPQAIASWRQKHPLVAIQLEEHTHSDAVAEAVTVGRADIGIGPSPSSFNLMHATVVLREELVITTSRSDPLAGDASVEMGALAEREWIHYHPKHMLEGVLNTLAAEAGFAPNAVVRVEQTAAVPILASVGIGIGLTPETILGPRSNVHTLGLSPPVSRDLLAWTIGGDDRIANTFVEHLASTWRDLIPPASGAESR